ncbi:GNAT family N-acetyltransferase [Aliirhizobium terrae]|uniref:GNAT family N-acetyltransferase n=1 Tax=Terrirhizobium terrae TaxID=2926709 RepID=UPI0025786678|nr:GNAT family N-acetyltransferase [Rhizobium sp. CC-CFT758]WJH42372.1 GNAT family N-acetyltransferase [Rhizobium sp. CC-CFT758]
MQTVRRCEAADIAEWARLRHALWPDGSADGHAAEIAAALSDGSLRGYLAVSGEGEAIGFAEISIRRYANGSTQSPVPFLEGIWIAVEYRRHGIGQMLIERISTDCAAEGFVELCSDAEIDNLASHHAHESWGFAETERVVYFRKPL